MHWIANFLFFQQMLEGLGLGEGAEDGEPFHNLCQSTTCQSPKIKHTDQHICGSLGTGAAVVASATQKLCCDAQGKPHRFLLRPSIGPIQI